MPSHCVIVGCINHRKRDLKTGEAHQYFSIPKVKETEGELVHQLTERRRREWVAQIKRKDVTCDRVRRHHTVCSDHFIKGKPAYEMYTEDPDWIPTLNLDLEKYAPRPSLKGQKGKKKAETDDQKVPQDEKANSVTTRSRQKDVCCVKGCGKQRPKEGSVKKTFFPFPREDARCKQWLKNCGRQELMERSPIQLRSQGFKICSEHFEDSQFQYSAGPTSQRLIPDAVPTLFKKSRRPGSKSSQPKETQKKKPCGQLQVNVSSLTQAKGAGGEHLDHIDFWNAEQMAEIKLEIDYAEDPALHWMTSQSVAEVPPEGGGDGETATTVQSLPAAGHIKVEPMDTHTDTVPVNTPPPHTDSEPLDIKTEPQDIKAEPLEPDIKTEPLDIRTEPLHDSTVNMRPEPLDIKAEPLDISTELLHVNTVPLNTRPKPLDIKPEPVYFEEPWAESGSTNPMPDNQTGSVVLSTDAHCDNQTGSLDSFTDAQSPVTDAPSLAERERCVKKEPVDRNGSLPLSRVFWSAI